VQVLTHYIAYWPLLALSVPRLRTPNEWDSLVHWQDVLLWRNYIYNVVIQAFNALSEVAPQLHQMGYRDKAWSVNKMGHIAYK
jgi:transformation/transcription domain-associated protein